MKRYVPVAAVITVLICITAALLVYEIVPEGDPQVDADGDAGIVSIEGTGTYAPGDIATLVADLRDGYVFDGWYDDAGNHLCETLVFCVGASDSKYHARTVEDHAVTVTVDADYGISEIRGDHRYLPGSEVLLEAFLKPGYVFEGWFSDDGRLLSRDTSMRITASDSLYHARASSNLETHIDLEPDDGIGSVSGAGTHGLGDEVVLRAELLGGYLFDGWYDEDGMLLGTDLELTVNAEGQTISVRTYIHQDVELRLKTDKGVAAVTGAGQYGTNDVVTITAELRDGYSFNGWYTIGGVRYSADLTTTVRMGDTDLVLKASTAHDFTYFPMSMAGSTAYGQETNEDGMYAFVCAAGADPEQFRGWFDLDGRLVSKDIQYTPASCDTVLIAKMSERFHHGDNLLIVEEFPDWYDEHCYCIVTEFHSNSYVTSFKGFDQALVSVIPGVYEFTFYNGLHDDSMVYSKVRHTVEGEMRHLFAWNYDGEHYEAEWVFDQDTYDSYAALDVNRAPGHDDVQRFFEYGKEPVKGFASALGKLSEGMTETQRAGFVLEFVHCVISYQPDPVFNGSDEWWKYPYETIADHRGDCEDSSILYGSLMKAMGYDAVLLLVYNDVEVHAGIGLALDDGQGDSVEYGGTDYYYCETTGVYWQVGQRPQGYDMEIVVPIE